MKNSIFVIAAFMALGCNPLGPDNQNDAIVNEQEAISSKTLRNKTNDGITHCQVIEKTPRNKAGKPMKPELYLRCSVQDYFIKFCESQVQRQDVEPFIDQGISVKMEVREGEWDNCTGKPGAVQSRIGYYAVILNLH